MIVRRFLSMKLFAFLLACMQGMAVTNSVAAPNVEFKIEKAASWVKDIAPDLKTIQQPEKIVGGVSYLLVDRQVLLKGDSKHSYTHIAFKIENDSGLNDAANTEIRFDPSYQALFLHSVLVRRDSKSIPRLTAPAVKILQREKSLEYLIFDGSKTANLFLEDIRVGDVIEYSYTVSGSNPIFGGKHFGQFDLQWGIPVQRAYARLVADVGRNITVKLANTDKVATVRRDEKLQEHEWNDVEIPSLRVKEDAPQWFDPFPKVQWSEFKDWNDVVSWGVRLYQTPARFSGELSAEIERIKGASSDPERRVVEALRYVQRTIRYLGVEVGPGSHAPTQPEVVLARRFGDCKDKTLLTITMLKALGIEAAPALVSSKVKRGTLERQATPGAFDHVIVHVKLNNESYWLDPTMAPQEGALKDVSQANFGYALVLVPDQSELTEMKLVSSMTYVRRVISVIDSSGGSDKPVGYTVTTMLEGLSAERLRNSFAKESAADLQKHMLNYFARYYPSIVVERPYELRDNKLTNQISLTEYYTIPEFWKNIPAVKVEAYAASPDVNEYLRAPQTTIRSDPLAVAHPVDVRQTTYWLVPSDWKFKDGTDRINDPVFDFESSVAYEPGRLILIDKYRSRADFVDPANMKTYLASAKKARDSLGYSITRSIKPVN